MEPFLVGNDPRYWQFIESIAIRGGDNGPGLTLALTGATLW
jgi:hypothetical protein